MQSSAESMDSSSISIVPLRVFWAWRRVGSSCAACGEGTRMPINLPNLDDRRYADLILEARAMIPSHAPQWTNYNPSDPGITLIELFAYLTELLMYRQNRIADANVRAFLKLIDGVDRGSLGGDDLSEEVRKVVAALRKPNRAVTSADFEELVLAAFEGQVARVRAVPRRNIEPDDSTARNLDKPGHVSVIIVPAGDNRINPMPDPQMIQAVKDYLEPRRLLTTRVHVVGPRYAAIGVRLTISIKSDAVEATVKNAVVEELVRYFDPLRGGQDATGWPFGRNVWVSEIYELLDRMPGVDYVTQTFDDDTPLDEIVAAANRLIKHTSVDPVSGNKTQELVGVAIAADELVSSGKLDMDITVVSPIAISNP